MILHGDTALVNSESSIIISCQIINNTVTKFILKVEGLARVSKHAEKTATNSDRGV